MCVLGVARTCQHNWSFVRMCSLTIECVLLHRMCSLTVARTCQHNWSLVPRNRSLLTRTHTSGMLVLVGLFCLIIGLFCLIIGLF